MTRPAFDVVLPDPDPISRADGYRLRLSRDPMFATYTKLTSEQVLPEKVADIKANAVSVLENLILSEEEARWLRDQLSRLLLIIDEEREGR